MISLLPSNPQLDKVKNTYKTKQIINSGDYSPLFLFNSL
jgi:hypothetical protein